ncbi:MAG: hypothetical protein JSS97_10060 [Actinobacteria bacterium]|nr:hypothetical protein [Actinomycetota bacterium]
MLKTLEPVERFSQRVADDFLVLNFDALKERLVEQAAFVRLGLAVGGQHGIHQRERLIEHGKDTLMLDAQFVNPSFGSASLSPNTGLLLGE